MNQLPMKRVNFVGEKTRNTIYHLVEAKENSIMLPKTDKTSYLSEINLTKDNISEDMYNCNINDNLRRNIQNMKCDNKSEKFLHKSSQSTASQNKSNPTKVYQYSEYRIQSINPNSSNNEIISNNKLIIINENLNVLRIACFLLSILWVTGADGAIIPPKWADSSLNPCSVNSWQYLHWPMDNKCYKIFTQGPCKDYEEFHFDHGLNEPACRCGRGYVRHTTTKSCHKLYQQHPCQDGEYLTLDKLGQGICKKAKLCRDGEVFWPQNHQCYLSHTQGPCIHGKLIHKDPYTGQVQCGCDQRIMKKNHWVFTDTCYELYTRGPCVQGHIYIYNKTIEATECLCTPALVTNYHAPSRQCYELETIGPCKPGQIFTFDQAVLSARCKCLPGYVLWEPNGHCYREYTKGPCRSGFYIESEKTFIGTSLEQDYFLIPGHSIRTLSKDPVGQCILNRCKGGQLYDPKSDICFPVGHKGPCPMGQLWVYEKATSLKGACHCDSQLVGYWPPNNECYQIGSQGPCQEMHVLSYDLKLAKLTCKCDPRFGYLDWTNQCIKLPIHHKSRNSDMPWSILHHKRKLRDRKTENTVAEQGQSNIRVDTSTHISSDLETESDMTIVDKDFVDRKRTFKNSSPSVSSLVTDSYSVVTINNKRVKGGKNIVNKNNRKNNKGSSKVKIKIHKDEEEEPKNKSSVISRILSILFENESDVSPPKTHKNKRRRSLKSKNKVIKSR